MSIQKTLLIFLGWLWVAPPVCVMVGAIFRWYSLDMIEKLRMSGASILIALLIFSIPNGTRRMATASRRQHYLSGLAAIIVILTVYLLVYPLLPHRILFRKEIKTCEKIIVQVEAYRSKHGRYPLENDWNTLEIQPHLFDDSSPYFYNNHVIWNGEFEHTVGFGYGFDGYCFYNLDTKRWERLEGCK